MWDPDGPARLVATWLDEAACPLPTCCVRSRVNLEVGLPAELSSEIEMAPAVVDADGWREADLLSLLVAPFIVPVAIVPL